MYICVYVCGVFFFLGWCAPIGVCYSLREIKHLATAKREGGGKRGEVEARGIVRLLGCCSTEEVKH